MKRGDAVYQIYQGILRFGVIQKVFQKEDEWSYARVKWLDDETYVRAMKDLVELRNGVYDDYALSEYRVDSVKVFDAEKRLDTLIKIRDLQREMAQ